MSLFSDFPPRTESLSSSYEEQHAALESILKENEHLRRENQLLASIVASTTGEQPLQFLDAQQQPHQQQHEFSGEQRREQLSDGEKAELAARAAEALEAEIDSVRAMGEKDMDDLRTLMEEVNLRIGETKKATYDFKRDVILGGEDLRDGTISADKLIKLMEDRIAGKEALLEKVNLKNVTYKAAITKLEAQLAHNEEMGEVLRPVDFDQLKIENEQHVKTINTKNKELLALKHTTTLTTQALNDVKLALKKLEEENARVRASIAGKCTEVAALEAAFARAQQQQQQQQNSAAETSANHRLADINLTDAPRVMDYVKTKSLVSKLEKAADSLRQKNSTYLGKK